MSGMDGARVPDPRGEPVRVLYLDNSFTFGGAINSLLHLLRGLAGERVHPVVVTGQSRDFVEREVPGSTCYQVELRLPWIHNRWHTRLQALPPFRIRPARRALGAARAAYWLLFRTLPEALRYYAIGKRHRVSVVHLNNNLESQPAGILAARLLGVPCVVHSRSFQAPHWSLRAYDGLVAHHVAISGAVKQNLLDAGIPPGKVTVVHDGIDLDEFSGAADIAALRAEFGLHDGERTFGLFGRIVGWKGTREFVQAAAGVFRQVPLARAFVVGDVSDGSDAYLAEVRRLIRELGIEDRVVLTGYRRDVPALMKLMDVVVHASTEPEPFGMVLIEGMAMGKPIVATEGGGPDDVVLRGKTGLLVPRGDAAALGEAVAELLLDPARAAAMGRAGRERAEGHFTKERYADQVMRIYGGVLSGRVPAPAPAPLLPGRAVE